MKTIKYIGVAPLPEEPITGSKRVWDYGQIQVVSDAVGAQLLTTGLFQDDAGEYVTAKTNPLTGEVSFVAQKATITKYRPQSIPVGLAPTATWGNTTGAFTLSTGLGGTYSGGLYLYFAGVGVNGSSGGPGSSGFYWCVMSGLTTGVAYGNMYDPTIENYPNAPTGVITLATVAGSHVPTIDVSITAKKSVISGGTMGENGIIQCEDLLSYSTSANIKNSVASIGSCILISNAAGNNMTTQTGIRRMYRMYNCGSQANNIVQPWVMSAGFTGSAPTISAVNTAIDQTLNINLKLTNTADWIILVNSFFSVEAFND